MHRLTAWSQVARKCARKRAIAAPSVITLLVTHAEGGGVERHAAERWHALRALGEEAWVLRPMGFQGSVSLQGPPEFRCFTFPEDEVALTCLLRAHVSRIEVHHLRSHHPLLPGFLLGLGLPFEVTLHDYAMLCPRANLVNAAGRYCGEPAVNVCDACIADEEIAMQVAPRGVAAMRAEWASFLGAAVRVTVPSVDAQRRWRRHLPDQPTHIGDWEDEAVPPGLPTSPAFPRVLVAGNLGVAKGYAVLRECAADAAERRLPLDYVYFGTSMDDPGLAATGRCHVLGPYPEEAAPAWFAGQQAALGFLPSIWPETWCYALGAFRRAGLKLACFDLGAQAARVRQAGGLVLPLGLPAPLINDAFIRYMETVMPSIVSASPQG